MASVRYLVWGLVILLLGLQFRAVESFVLTQKASHFVEHNLSSEKLLSMEDPYSYRTKSYKDTSLLMASGPVTPKRMTPPRWLGWALISVGAVLLFHGVSNRS